MPPTMNLSSEKLEPHGCYLVENGHEILLWIGKNAVPLLCKDLLGVSSVQEIQSGQVPLLPRLKTPLSERITTMISHLESERQVTYYPTIYIIKEDAAELRSRFLNHLVEDRQPTGPTAAGANQQSPSSGMSYFQWLGYIRSKSQ
jgi:protein transport protein SEC24